MFTKTMIRTLPLFYFKKSHHFVSQFINRNFVTSTQCKKTFESEVYSYFNNNQDKNLDFQCENIQMYKGDILKLQNTSLKVTEMNVKENLEIIFNMINKLTSIVDPEIRKEYMDDLDIRCFSQINHMQPSEILKLLNLFFKIMPKEFRTSYFFDKSLENLINFAKNQTLTDHETVQLLWYISLNAAKYKMQIAYFKPYLPDIDKLSFMEKCIFVQSFYATSMKLSTSQTKVIVKTLERDFKQVIANPNYLIIFCKALLISETRVDINLDSISESILNFKEPIDFLTATYLLNLYGLTLIYQEKVTDKLVRQSIDRLNENLIDKKFTIPLMHLEKFLWSISFLGVCLNRVEKLIIKEYMERRYEEFKANKKNSVYLLNCFVNLIMLRSYSVKLIRQSLEDRLFDPFFKDNSRWKMERQVQMLLTFLSTEVKLLNFIPRKFFEKKTIFQYSIPERIYTVADVADDLAKKNIIINVEIECPIHSIRIPGVTFSTATETFHIDVLDNLTCFKETTIPHGLMRLKFRLLSRLGYRLIKIDESIFKDEPKKIEACIEKEIVNRIKYGEGWKFRQDSMV